MEVAIQSNEAPIANKSPKASTLKLISMPGRRVNSEHEITFLSYTTSGIIDSTINSFITPAIRDQDSLMFGFFPTKIMNKAPIADTKTASKGFIEIIVSISKG
jgi:hypothetical protein